MTTLSQASHQWATRPADQRFLNLHDLYNRVHTARVNSTAKVVPTKVLEFVAGEDHKGLQIVGQNGTPADVTHFSFGQLAQLGKAPAGYLRDLPAELVADNLNYGLKFRREQDEVGVLLTRDTVESPLSSMQFGGQNLPLTTTPVSRVELRAATGPNYGRIWDDEIAASLINRFGNGIDGDFRVPGEFGKKIDVTKANTTIYASDRDMFVFLADEVNRVEIPNRRNGQSGSLARGFFVWNSEVGDKTFGVAMFLFDYACKNRTVWGVKQFSEMRLRHTVSAPSKWLDQVEPLLIEYANSSPKPVEDTIKAAQAKKLDSELDEFLKNRKFTAAQVRGIKATHEAEEGRPIETLWDATVGITAFAKTIQYQDDRVSMERAAGKVLDLVAA